MLCYKNTSENKGIKFILKASNTQITYERNINSLKIRLITNKTLKTYSTLTSGYFDPAIQNIVYSLDNFTRDTNYAHYFGNIS